MATTKAQHSAKMSFTETPSIFCCPKVRAVTKPSVTEPTIFRHLAFSIAGKYVPRHFTVTDTIKTRCFVWVRQIDAESGKHQNRQFFGVANKMTESGSEWGYFDISGAERENNYAMDRFEKMSPLVEFACKVHTRSRYLARLWKQRPEPISVSRCGTPEEALQKCRICGLFKPVTEYVQRGVCLPRLDRCVFCQVKKQAAIMVEETRFWCAWRDCNWERTREAAEWRAFVEGMVKDKVAGKTSEEELYLRELTANIERIRGWLDGVEELERPSAECLRWK